MRVTQYLGITTLIFIITFITLNAHAKQIAGIVATVNDEAI